LRAAAIRVEDQGRRFERAVGDLYARVNSIIVNPATFGSDKGGKEFFAKWDSYVREWDEGVRSVTGSVLATARGIDNMADAVDRTDKDTKHMADELDRFAAGGATPGVGGGSNLPNIPPLTAPPASGGSGSGGGHTGGTHGRR
jgi:hypothetical protein